MQNYWWVWFRCPLWEAKLYAYGVAGDAVSVRCPEASAHRRFLKYYFYDSFNPFLAACPFLGGCPLLGGSVMGGSTVYIYIYICIYIHIIIIIIILILLP